MNQNNIIKSVLLLTGLASPLAFSANFESPDSVENTIEKESTPKQHWREELSNKGVTFGADYLALGLSSPNGSQGNSVNRSSGIARFYGSWHLVGNGTENTGGIVWKVEHRHAYSSTAPKNMAFIDDISNGPEGLGYVGMIAPAYNDQGTRVTNLHWKQKFNDGKTSLIVGWQDVTDYVDTYALASPWTGFTNLAFSTGSGVMGLPDDGILAISAGHMVTDHFYVVAGIADAKGKSDDIFDGFDTAFHDSTYFKTLELGWADSQDQIYTDNFHVTLWHFDEGSRHSLSSTVLPDGTVIGGESGQGVNFSWSKFVTAQFMPFVRGGVSEGDVALFDKSLSVGFGYFGLGANNNNLGFAVNWSETNSNTLQKFMGAEKHQTTAELYYNMQIGDHFQITPDIQYINNPALSSESSAWVFGLRARIFI
ncbi:porin [Aliivibrio finisterrensis]|uniref:Porin n=1 Tax=Aliivibrio finisterrensis TaxID=511998 RepID=A0A4Q5KLS5_9GAMM|nr:MULTISPECIES: carbohydrate porin [Aliivibrio]MDD9173459.1 carbohydrate porin [Aliivibrio sp. S3TY1]MDD9190535.1 carbohydrate porin [Aliivibrio sp. S2TY2]RYU47336.1 porin [Aliivibrio finisterrensis]